MRTLKHQWLFLNTLDNVATVRRLVAFYVEAHNTQIPHSAFRGQTPDEMYYGRGQEIPDHLEEAKRRARAERVKANREMLCALCQPLEEKITNARAAAWVLFGADPTTTSNDVGAFDNER